MKMYKNLVRTFLLSGEMPKSEKKNKVKFYITLGVIATLFIFIPCFILMAFLVGVTTDAIKEEALMNIAYQANIGNGLLLVIQFVCVFSMIFGFNIILNSFYFSGDIEHILPLPIKPKLLISSKFMSVLISESIMELLFLIAAFLGFLIVNGFNILNIVMSIIGVLTLPILPLVYCSIIALIIMKFTKLIKNKNNGLTILLLGILIIIGMVAIGYLNNDSITEFTHLLATGEVGFLNIMNYIFPSTYFLVEAVESTNIGAFIIYLLINAVAYVIFMMLADKLYIPGVKKISSNAFNSKKTLSQTLQEAKKTNYIKTYLSKELKILTRTPAFFSNCILSNLLWPIIIILIYLIQGQDNIIIEFVNHYKQQESLGLLVVFISVFAISAILTTSNSIASSSISREGKHFPFMKYIPVDYKTQINIKAATSIIVSFGFNLVYLLIICYFLEAGFIDFLVFTLVSFLSCVFFTYLGIYLDTINPKLIWEDELNSLRGNENTFFSMAISMIIAVVLGGGIYYLNRVILIPLSILKVMLIILLLMGMILIYHKVMTKGIENIEEVEI
ncbi:MAG TPA: hypothetical protein IAB35_06050 [Candidatus Faecimonas gallistercoris]|mgnify:CR=1 FL=1|nr:hypothetical protein [Candidatus Faecimonas gallistercoris]